ncbi:MAG: S9 family peptidase [Sphingomonadales bacterium]|nr:S9 family peptidase [Sphingomonadales bacterium]
MSLTARALAAASLLTLALAPSPAMSQPVPTPATAPITYPETRRSDVVDVLFGERVADPYRWLENSVLTDPEVSDWVKRENAVTQNYLATLPQRDWFARRMRDLLSFERFGLPVKAGTRYFYMRNSGLQNQSQLFVRQGLGGTPRLLLDPNSWAKDGATALDEWKPSDDGRLLLYSVQDGGSDWRTLKLLDVAHGTVLADEIRWAKFTQLSWVGSKGFLYSRMPEPKPGEEFTAKAGNSAIWYHAVGTSQAQDRLVLATPDHPELYHEVFMSSNGRYGLIRSYNGTDERYELRLLDFSRRGEARWQPRVLVRGFDHDWKLVDAVGNRLWLVTNKDAPRYRMVAVDLAKAEPQWLDVIPQQDETLREGTIVGRTLVVSYLKDAASRAVLYDLGGGGAHVISLNDIGTASGFHGRPGDPETFYQLSSFNRPATIFRMNLASGETSVFAAPRLTFKPEDYLVEQRFYASKDGTRVPIFVVRKRSLANAGKAVPTLLYGYGGFNIALTPGFSAARMAWLEAGGAFALANLRGGGEYGKAWHDAGRGANKQNVFDDFVAAGEYLIAQGIAPKGGLAVQGGSNGGLLIGAAVNQRPDLFAAANPQVGVMDMLRFDRFTEGRTWVDDYGRPEVEADFRLLRAYSPYHNIRSGTVYPAVLVTTAETDDRVVPGHSFKYTAALQAAQTGPRPHLIRVETRAGHGSGKPTDKVIGENADILAFLAQWTGLQVR